VFNGIDDGTGMPRNLAFYLMAKKFPPSEVLWNETSFPTSLPVNNLAGSGFVEIWLGIAGMASVAGIR